MKKYNNYSYISPIGVVSEVKKRLNKYFATNQLDESMIGIHIENCIRKLGVGALEKAIADGYADLEELYDYFVAEIANQCGGGGGSSYIAPYLKTGGAAWCGTGLVS